MIASLADLLRLLAIPILGWAAYRDVLTRRVPNETWWPLAAIAVLALLLDGGTALDTGNSAYFIRVAISLGFLVPLAYGFWWMGGFGGADAKAFMVLAALFPVYPRLYLDGVILPLEPSQLGVFSITILSNTVVVGLAYPLVVALGNAVRGHFGPPMVLGRPIRCDETTTEYGRLLESNEGFTRRGLDLDALRMYLQWRDVTLEELRADPDRYRDPASLPDTTADPGDGSIATDGGERGADTGEDVATAGEGGRSPPTERTQDEANEGDHGDDGEADPADPWGAAAFLDDIDHSAYGTSAEQLRGGLDLLVDRDVVWLSPGIPFIVPTFFGLLLALTYGDVLFVLLRSLGLA